MQPTSSEEAAQPLNGTEKESMFAPLHKVTPVSRVLAAVVFIILPFVGFWIGTGYGKYKAESVIVSEAPVDTVATSTRVPSVSVATPKSEGDGIVIYSVSDGSVSDASREYPILSLYKRDADGVSSKFATVGALGEYPGNFAVNPDRSKVAVTLGQKLVLIDVETGAKETIYTAKTDLTSVTFSPDGTKLAFVNEDDYLTEAELPRLYTYDLAEKKVVEQVESPDIARGFNGVSAWRSDNVLVLSITLPKGCFQTQYRLFDLKTKSLTNVDGGARPEGFMDGSYVIKMNDARTPTACESEVGNNMCGDLVYLRAKTMSVVDPVTATVLGTFGDGSQSVEYVALSPQADKVMYSESPMPSTADQCNYGTGVSVYKIKNLKSGEVNVVTNFRDQLKLWGITLQDKNDPSYIYGSVITPSISLETIN